MFEVGDLILYGSTGVCELIDITILDFPYQEKNQNYYVLKPLYHQQCVIYCPVDNPKVFMRPIISEEEAKQLIDMIPNIEAEAYHSTGLRELINHYEAFMKTYNCADLIELTMSIYAKKKALEKQKRKFGAIDERFMKKAEKLLFGELAAALNLPKEEIPDYIVARIKNT